MNRLLTIIVTIVLSINLIAQTPEAISYQAVLRNTSNELLANTNISMRISILRAAADGPQVYAETNSTTTNASGLISVEIGKGATISGEFTSIDWGGDTYFIKTETDPEGGNNYSIIGISQLLSVPYALHAKTAERIVNGGFSIDVEVKDASDHNEHPDEEDAGEISVRLNGGTAPYRFYFKQIEEDNHSSYKNNNGRTYESSITFKRLSSSYYEIYAEDANGAYAQRKVFVGHNSPIANITNIQPSCSNSATGSFDFTVEGGTPHYHYRVNNSNYLPYTEGGVTVSNINDYFELNVIDAKGKEAVIYINGKMLNWDDVETRIPYYKPNIILTSVDACSGADGGIEVTIPDGTEGLPFTYEWYKCEDDGVGAFNKVLVGNDKNLTNVGMDPYQLEITTAAGCKSGEIIGYIGASFSPTIVNERKVCWGIDIDVLDYTGNISYEWSDTPDFTTIISTEEDLSGVEKHKQYYLRVTNNEGCISDVYSFYHENEFNVDLDVASIKPCQDETNGSIDISINYFEGESLDYIWAADRDFNIILSTEEDLLNIGSDEYFLKITNEKGCELIRDFSLSYFRPYLDVYEQSASSPTASDGSVQISVTDGGNYNFEWATDWEFSNIISTNEDLNNVAPGEYYLRITDNDNNGCSIINSFNVYSN